MIDNLEDSRELWDSHARRDPLWAILSDPTKKGGKWDITRFFQTGVGEISWLLYQLRSRGIVVRQHSALDFGCGVGRLTQALATHFDNVVGVDVSSRMIELACELNRCPQRASYVANRHANLAVFRENTFDFIVSNLVLQHIRPEITVQYLREFFRVLVPGGISIFQLPSHQRGPEEPSPPPALNAMPDEAYHASITVVSVPAGPVQPAAEIALEVEVANASVFPWSQHEFGVIRAGNHWLDGAGMLLIADDGRSSLPVTLHPGERCRLSLTITAPSAEGMYLCAIDLAHEGVVWFREKGSTEMRFPMQVRRHGDVDDEPATTLRVSQAGHGEPRAPELRVPLKEMTSLGGQTGANSEPGAFPMYGVQKGVVMDLIAAEGAEIIHVEDDRSCGDEWVSYRYFVLKTR